MVKTLGSENRGAINWDDPSIKKQQLTAEEIQTSRENNVDIDKIKDLLDKGKIKSVNRKNLNIVQNITKGFIVNVDGKLAFLPEGPLSMVQFFRPEVTLEEIQEKLDS